MSDRALRAKILLEEAAALGVELADLVAADTTVTALPTVADYLATIAPTFTEGTAATYRPYWRLAIGHIGDRRLAEVTVVDLQGVVAHAVARAKRRRPTTTGRSSQETCIAALRAVFGRARAAGLIRSDPAALLRKPRRVRSRRRALDDGELAELIDAVRATSNDPELDLLVVRFHLESGARRQGALNLRLRDTDISRATVWLREKGDSDREQPVSPSLIRLLEATPEPEAQPPPTMRSCGPARARSPLDATTGSSGGRGAACPGRTAPLCPLMCCATPPSPPSAGTGIRSPRHSPATPRRRSPGGTCKPAWRRSPR